MKIKIILLNLVFIPFIFSMEQEKPLPYPKIALEKILLCNQWVENLNKLPKNSKDYSETCNLIYKTINNLCKEDQLDAWLTMLKYSVEKNNKKLTKRFCRAVYNVFETHFEQQEDKNDVLSQIQARALALKNNSPLRCFKKLDELCSRNQTIPRSPAIEFDEALATVDIPTLFSDDLLASIEEFLTPALGEPQTCNEILKSSLEENNIAEPKQQFTLFKNLIERNTDKNRVLARYLFNFLNENIYEIYFSGCELDGYYKKKLNEIASKLSGEISIEQWKQLCLERLNTVTIPPLDLSKIKDS